MYGRAKDSLGVARCTRAGLSQAGQDGLRKTKMNVGLHPGRYQECRFNIFKVKPRQLKGQRLSIQHTSVGKRWNKDLELYMLRKNGTLNEHCATTSERRKT